jgi:hypothetical protein
MDLTPILEVRHKRSEVRLAAFLGKVHKCHKINQRKMLIKVLAGGVNKVISTSLRVRVRIHASRLIAEIVRVACLVEGMSEEQFSSARVIFQLSGFQHI